MTTPNETQYHVLCYCVIVLMHFQGKLHGFVKRSKNHSVSGANWSLTICGHIMYKWLFKEVSDSHVWHCMQTCQMY